MRDDQIPKQEQSVVLLSCLIDDGATLDEQKEQLWNCVIAYEGEDFATMKGLPFTYELKKTRKGEKSGEIIFSRKNKGVTRSTVELAYERVIEMRAEQNCVRPIVSTPKQLNAFGASCIYALFIKFQIILPE